MESVILITESISLEGIRKTTSFSFQKESESVLHYSTKDHFLSLIYSDAGADEYEEEEMEFNSSDAFFSSPKIQA